MPTPMTAREAPPSGQYAIDPAGSSVTFATRHMFGLAPVRGTLAATIGVLTIAEPAEGSRAEAEVSAASFSTRNVLRDPQVRSGLFLNVRRHPEILFRTTGVRRNGEAWTVSGVLTVKGKPAPLDLTVTDVTVEGATLVVRASGTVDRYAHGVTMMRGMAARHLSVEITVRATRVQQTR
jgi:polyisoprenoid-binding protein YceI